MKTQLTIAFLDAVNHNYGDRHEKLALLALDPRRRATLYENTQLLTHRGVTLIKVKKTVQTYDNESTSVFTRLPCTS